MAKGGRRIGATNSAEVRTRLIDATITVLARDGFALTSGRAVAAEADTVNGSIFYHFGSMDGLLAATVRTLSERGIERIRAGLGGDNATTEWSRHLPEVLRREIERDDGKAVMELFVGARTAPELAAEVHTAIDDAIAYATEELTKVLEDTPLGRVAPVELVAQLASATFIGIEVLAQNGHSIDLERATAFVSTGIGLFNRMARTDSDTDE